MAGALVVTGAPSESAPVPTFEVNMTADIVDPIIDGTCDVNILAAGSQCTLRAAIQEANAAPDADVIYVPAGTYRLTLTGATDITGDLDVTQPVTILGAGAGATTITASDLLVAGARDRVFDVWGAASVFTLEDVTVTGGSTFDSGAGIMVSAGGAAVTLRNVVLRDNRIDAPVSVAPAGAGIAVSGGVSAGRTLVIEDTEISGNVANAVDYASSGGGVWFVGADLTLTRAVIRDNVVDTEGIARGGGVAVSGTGSVTVTDSTIADNSATSALVNASGGGLDVVGGSLQMSRSTVSGNEAKGFTLWPVDTGGGGVTTLAPGTLENVTVSGNTATHAGGGLYTATSVDLRHVTVTGNTVTFSGVGMGGAEQGGGVETAVGGAISVGASILSGNWGFDCEGNVTSSGGNVTETCPFGTGSKPIGLGALANNGGSTMTHAINDSSRAFNAASCLSAADQRGQPRPWYGGCDAGAYEFTGTCVANCGGGGSTTPTTTTPPPTAVPPSTTTTVPTIGDPPPNSTTTAPPTTTTTTTAPPATDDDEGVEGGDLASHNRPRGGDGSGPRGSGDGDGSGERERGLAILTSGGPPPGTSSASCATDGVIGGVIGAFFGGLLVASTQLLPIGWRKKKKQKDDEDEDADEASA